MTDPPLLGKLLHQAAQAQANKQAEEHKQRHTRIGELAWDEQPKHQRHRRHHAQQPVNVMKQGGALSRLHVHDPTLPQLQHQHHRQHDVAHVNDAPPGARQRQAHHQEHGHRQQQAIEAVAAALLRQALGRRSRIHRQTRQPTDRDRLGPGVPGGCHSHRHSHPHRSVAVAWTQGPSMPPPGRAELRLNRPSGGTRPRCSHPHQRQHHRRQPLPCDSMPCSP